MLKIKYFVFMCFVALLFTSRGQPQDLDVVEAFPNLRFTSPVFITHSNDGSNRLFVLEQAGLIKVFPNDPNITTAETFLDIRDRVNDSGGEMGLLGLAFHPDFNDNGFFYVDYTTGDRDTRRTVVSRFQVSQNDPNRGDADSEFILLEVPQFQSNHNGGMLQFGPADGFLYISLGDGGGGGDPRENGQDRTTLLGSILRIDVDNPTGDLNYGIPPDNPLVGNLRGFREEIWIYGLRNPWRFSIDAETGEMWIGDVGQGSWEEIDLGEKGNNYGWNIMEGFHCFPPGSNCDDTDLTLPIVEYSHDFNRRSVTGGYIYRGALRPELDGAYIYGDFTSGDIWMLRYENAQLTSDSLLINTELGISSFGLDANDELYILDYFDGVVFRFSENPTTSVSEPTSPTEFALNQNYPNPFNPSTTIRYRLETLTRVELSIYNTLGQKVKTLLNKLHESGEFQIQWDGTNDSGETVSSGVYLYQLKSEELVQTRKMILMK
ncbi:T9SS type A sorting domain-containing protein [candidate division KSB1 bacterium]|nr:T9SS type A sorting domain-containing protein [candidate division KSB1 bacterium]NIR71961.1 T9SS type A sorting domain-containing protein [candidate division KSB1 bacterium]NIS24959.1 T9SS type A sorting domain-containing protein [candidate division KSB1 bacterium]NIT71879.1 T9SS type A sorting domain-containing protein [candidate division KSB1 bacterium]NIU25610.1 T9SS type A sorting domain-containing protein [candidate division KSB1 bacterium]